jgi:hypothetical protein
MWYAYSAKGTGRRDWRLVAGPNPHLQLIPWFPQSIQESPQVIIIIHFYYFWVVCNQLM